jgi:hypothetical protein
MRITRLVLATLVVAVSAHAGEPEAPLAPMAPGAAPAATESAADGEQRNVTMGPTSRDAQGNEGRVHTVAKGDTLWAISAAYLGSPLAWPKLWKSNPAVKDPHWIYPGEQIWISGTEMRPLTKQEASTLVPVANVQEDTPVRTVGAWPVPDLEKVGLVSEAQFDTAGELIGSPESEKWLAANRRAYVSLGEGQVREGDRFTVVRENERVRDPETGRRLGVHVEKLGWLEITKVGPQSSEALIRVSSAEMRRGDRLIPRVQSMVEVPMHLDTPAQVDGEIAFLPDRRTISSQRDVIFLNRGVDDGLEVGSTLEVYRPGRVEKDRVAHTKHVLPDEVVANLIVVEAEPNSSVAVATHATLELSRGDHFRTAPGATTSIRASVAPDDGAQWTARTIEGRNEGLPPAKGVSTSLPAKAAPKGAPAHKH